MCVSGHPQRARIEFYRRSARVLWLALSDARFPATHVWIPIITVRYNARQLEASDETA